MSEQKFVLTFNGIDDHLEFSKDFPTLEQAITIEFWAKGEDNLTQEMTILEAHHTEGNRVLHLRLSGVDIDQLPRLFWTLGNEEEWYQIDQEIQVEEYNSWTHWAFVKDVANEKILIYCQGEIWQEAESTTKSLAGLSKFTLGCGFNLSQFWKGSLAEFRIWDYARSATEIQQDHERFLKGDEPGLILYLPLNGDANDYTSSDHSAIIYGTTWTEEKLPFNRKSSGSSTKGFQSKTKTSSKSKSSKLTNSSASVSRKSNPSKRSKSTQSVIETQETVESEFFDLESDQELTTTTPKRLIVCCDVTWGKSVSSYPTNVLKFASLIKYIADDKTPQIVSYFAEHSRLDETLIESVSGDTLGLGIDNMIQDAYSFLCMNYDVNSQDEIYLIGFSQGAYIVRCLAGMISKCGLLKRSKLREIPQAYGLYRDSQISSNDLKVEKFRENYSQQIDTEQDELKYSIPIKMLGCFDTVGCLGMADVKPWFSMAKPSTQKYEFFDSKVSLTVENAFHAVAIDEKCKLFPPILMDSNDDNPNQVVQEVFFSGNHACIGGGIRDYQGLSDYPLKWMIHQAQKLGLEFYSSETESEELQIKLDPTTPFDHRLTGVYAVGGEQWRPIKTPNVAIHYSVVERLKACPEYRPPNLEPILKDLLVTETTN